MTKLLKFPEGFWWGAAMSGPQSEGWYGKTHENIMDTWYRKERKDFYDGVGPDVTDDLMHHLQEDFRLMKEAGIQSFRTSIQWTRLIEDFKTGTISPKGAEFYQAMIDAARENDISLVFNLHHFDMPTELLEKYGGWESRQVVDLFGKFARACFELYGDQVEYWTTFNEPMVIVDGGYLYGYHYPKYQNRGKEAVRVMEHIALASALAVREFKALGCPGKIGIILNLTPAYPKSDEEKDVKAAEFFDLFHGDFFMDAAVYGRFPEKLEKILREDHVWHPLDEADLKLLRNNTVDFVGINYYHPTRIQARNEGSFESWLPDQYYEHYEKPDRRVNPHKNWEIYPEAVYDIARMMREKYDNFPWYLSESGMGVHDENRFRNEEGMIDDQYRIDFYKEHLSWLHKAIEEGSSCFGFHAWAALDCWSWNNAYKNRYGFIEVDLDDQTRRMKKSGLWMRQTADNNGFEAD